MNAGSERNESLADGNKIDNSEMSLDQLDQVSGGAVEIREVVIKTTVNPQPPPPTPTPVPLPDIKIRF
jgi:hypothetical protein